MCGIVGFAGDRQIERALLGRMCDAIRHRGPDDDGFLITDKVALGMRRLAIIDQESGKQPIFNEDRSVAVVYNGEIYNFPFLRNKLQRLGHSFTTNTDTECIVHLYEEYGDKCVEHLRGMFAFALWDEKRNRLLLARDRVGKKPLYYRVTAQGIWFASELKSLIQDPSFPRSIDRSALHHYLTYQYVPQPWSIFEGVNKLPPAHTLSFEDGRPELKRYWSLDFSPQGKRAISEAQAVEELEELLRESVGVRLISDRPVGAFLSGGIDSSLVVGLMAEHSSVPVKTFSIGFEESTYDERRFARIVAERFECDHHEYVVQPSAIDVLPKLTWHYDEPYADSSAIPSYYLAQLTSNHVTVALNGDGGDEVFGGYSRYRGGLILDGWGRSLRPVAGIAPLANGLAKRAKHGTSLAYLGRFLTALGAGPSNGYASMISAFQNAEKAKLYSEEMRQDVQASDSWALLSDLFATSQAAGMVDKMLDIDTQTYLPGDLLAKIDIATMANSLEARSPLLDHRVMEFAASLPPEMKMSGQSQKVILKRLAAKLLPAEVIERRKMGFGVPIGSWLRTELRDMTHDLLLDSTARGRGYFDSAYVKDLIEAHESGTDHSGKLWTLLQFELWHRMFIDDCATSSPLAVTGST